MPSYDVQVVSRAAPEAVWSVLMDAASWPAWSRIDEFVTSRSTRGTTQPGSVRTFRTGSAVASERILALDPPRQLVYEGAENPYLRDYHATIELTRLSAGGTAIRWHGRFGTRLGMGAFMRWYLRRFQQSMANGLAAYAERLQP